MKTIAKILSCAVLAILVAAPASAQIGRRFPSEKKVIKDPKTGVELVFLTSQQGKGDSKIYQTHNQWTADGKWVIFRSNRVPGEAMAVNEETGVMVQVTEGGYSGMLCVARNSMNLYIQRPDMTDAQKAEMKQQKAKREEYAAKLKKILNDDQYEKYEKMQKHHRGHGGPGRHGCPHGPRPMMEPMD